MENNARCSYENEKHKYSCEEHEYENGLCFWHSDIPKDDFTIKEHCAGSKSLDAELRKYNYSVGTYLKEKSAAGGAFVDYNIKGANLKASDLSGANLKYINFAGADFRGASLNRARLSGANLEHALMTRTDLEGADLRGVNMERADVRWSNMKSVQLSGAHLEWADMRWCDLQDASIFNANMCFLKLDHANLKRVKLSSYRYSSAILRSKVIKYYRFGHYNKYTTFLGVNTNNINWANNRELKSFIIKQQFVDDFIKKSKVNRHIWAPLWRWTCDYGNSLFRWLMTATVVVITFGLIYSLGYGVSPAELHGNMESFSSGIFPNLLINSAFNWFTPLYFSIVTFTTLGFGDVTPLNLSAQIFTSLEVIAGYFMLGGLLTIFAEKFIIRE